MSTHCFTHLALSVDSYNATAGLVHGCHKNGLATDAIHVNASASLQVVEMDVAKLGDEVDDIMLGTHL